MNFKKKRNRRWLAVAKFPSLEGLGEAFSIIKQAEPKMEQYAQVPLLGGVRGGY
jgi:hypothetical protein